MRKTPAAPLAMMLFGATVPWHAQAAGLGPLDGFFLSVGIYQSSNNLDVRVDSTLGIPGTNLNFQRDLGFDRRHREPAWEVGGTIAGRHKVDAFGYSYDDTVSRTLSRDFTFGDETFVVGADLSGTLTADVKGVAYTWFFHRSDESALGVGLGGVRYELGARLAATLTNGDDTLSVAERFSEAAWAPLLRAEYIHVFSPHWRAGIEGAYVRKTNGSVTGDAIDAGVKVEYFPWRHFGLALRYNYNDVDLEYRRTRISAQARLESNGPQLMATARF